MRARRMALPVLAGALLLSGCTVIPTACSAVGYINTAFVSLADPRPGLTLHVCDGAGCTPGEGTDEGATGALRDIDTTSITGDSRGGWSVTMLGGQPVLGYRVTDAAGATVAEGEADADWVRVSGSEQCGGNHEARIVLDI